jgi:hypothetical protein
MQWKRIDQDPPRDGRAIFAFIFSIVGDPQFGLMETPVFLRWNGKAWSDLYKPDRERGDGSIGLWIEQGPPTQAEIDAIPPSEHPWISYPQSDWKWTTVGLKPPDRPRTIPGSWKSKHPVKAASFMQPSVV